MSYELFKQGPAVYLPIILLSLVITILAYGAFPFIFAKTRRKIITKKKYYTLCYCINLLISFLFSIFINGGSHSLIPYLLWTGVFSKSGLTILENQCVLEDYKNIKPNKPQKTETDYFNEIETPVSQITNENIPSQEDKIKFCRKCGKHLLDNSQFCRNCGTKIIRAFYEKGAEE